MRISKVGKTTVIDGERMLILSPKGVISAFTIDGGVKNVDIINFLIQGKPKTIRQWVRLIKIIANL